MGGTAASAYVDIPTIVRETIKEIGHTNAEYGFDTEICSVITAIDEQFSDTVMGVDKLLEAKK